MANNRRKKPEKKAKKPSSEKKERDSVAPRYEDFISDIDREIYKRRHKWSLTAIAWMDFDDVAQILRIHIFKKWHLYNTEKPLAPWLNRIISNQIKNLIRNNYGNFSRPCLKCAAAESEDACSIYEKQCGDCPLYAHWERTKKSAHDAKLPVSLENHSREVYSTYSESIDVEATAKELHKKMRTVLKPLEWKVYEGLYIKNLSEHEMAKIMGYKTSEADRKPGYKQIKNIKRSIIDKVKQELDDGTIDFK